MGTYRDGGAAFGKCVAVAGEFITVHGSLFFVQFVVVLPSITIGIG